MANYKGRLGSFHAKSPKIQNFSQFMFRDVLEIFKLLLNPRDLKNLIAFGKAKNTHIRCVFLALPTAYFSLDWKFGMNIPETLRILGNTWSLK